jgi:glucokinase
MRIGIDVGGTNIRVGLSEQGVIVKKIVEPTKSELSEKAVIEHLKQMITEVMHPNVEGIGIGVPSVVDTRRGIVYNVANIPSWEEVHLKTLLEEAFQLPVAVNNDCNCFALGEYHFGNGAAYRNLVCVALGTGVGTGIIIDGKLYEGNNTGAGEIGCLPYLEHDYEYYCGSRFFSGKYGLTGKEAFEQSGNHAPSRELWNEIGGHIGNLVKAILFTYDPQAIIFGGSISNAFNLFSGAMTETLKTFPYPETIRKIKIKLSDKEDVALLGATALL